MSEGRQVGLVLLGLLLLGAVGFGGAALFPDECDGLERRADLVLRYDPDPADVLDVDGAAADALRGLGDGTGLGPWRGAVAVPDGATLLPSEGGFFVVTDDAFVVLRPGFGATSNARGRDGLEVVPARRAIGLRADDGTTALYDGELDELRCGELREPSDVLDVDRGVSIVRTAAGGVGAVTLSGEQLWEQDLGAAPLWAHVAEREVAVGTPDGVRVLGLPEGLPLRELLPGTSDLLDARAGVLLLATDDGPVRIDLALGTVQPVPDEVPAAAALVPGGVLGAGVVDGTLVLRGSDVRAGAPVAGELVVEDVVTSDDGVVALLVTLDGERAVLQWGPVAA